MNSHHLVFLSQSHHTVYYYYYYNIIITLPCRPVSANHPLDWSGNYCHAQHEASLRVDDVISAKIFVAMASVMAHYIADVDLGCRQRFLLPFPISRDTPCSWPWNT